MSEQENLYEDEAALEDPDEPKFEDSSEEEEDDDKFEEDDFIVNDDGEDIADGEDSRPRLHMLDDEDDDTEIRKRKKKKKKRFREDSPELAEGDLQLLREGGVRIDRKKKLKRLRKGASDEDDNLPYGDDVPVSDEDDRFEERRRAADEPVDYDDDMDDFIDDGGRGRRRRAAEKEGLVSSETVRQARSLFGDVDDAQNYQSTNKLFKPRLDGDDENDKDYVEGEEPGTQQRPLRTIRERDTDRFEDVDEMPEADEPRHGMDDETIAQELGVRMDDTPEVERIVQTDIPERLQNQFGPDYKAPNEAEIAEEAKWVYKRGFQDNPLFSDFRRFDPEEVKRKINVVLSYIHIDNLDIPFIAMYRKDYITPFLIRPAGESIRQTPILDLHEGLDPSQVMEVPRGFNSYRYDDLRPGTSFEHKRGVPPGYDDGFGDWSILWQIFDLDKSFAELCQRRKHLLLFARKAADKGVPDRVIDDVKESLPTCDDNRLLSDAERYLRLAVELAEALNEDLNGDGDEREKKHTRRRKNYFDYCKRGFRDLAQEFGLSARQIGENMKGADEYGTGVQMHVPLDAEGEPHYLAGVFARRLDPHITGKPGAPEDKHGEKALKAASHVLTVEIIADLNVVQTARRILCKPGTVSVSTTPTIQGIAQVGDSHPLRSVTCLSEKKLESFQNTADFALIQRAEEQGYTKMEIMFQPEQLSSFERSLSSAILAPEEGQSSVLVEKWNRERMAVVDEVRSSLIKRMKDEIREELNEVTATALRTKLTQAASRRLLLGPGRPIPQEEGCPRVLAFCVTGEEDEDLDALQISKDYEDAKGSRARVGERRIARERLTIVDLDENGEYQNGYELFAGWLRRPTRRDNEASKLSRHVKDQLKSIITRSKAQIIVIGVGSGGRRVMRLQSDLVDVIREMASTKDEHDNRPQRMHMLTSDEHERLIRADEDMSDPRADLNAKVAAIRDSKNILSKYVVLVDDFPSRVFAKTDWSSVGMTMDAMTLLERRAVALARMAQEPLWVYCAIGLEEEHALRLQFHSYHYHAATTDRLVALERALCRAVCANGIDINRVLRLPHMKPMLPYVAGLGTHKAKALIGALENVLGEEERGLLSRKHLWSQNYLGRTVFLSTAAYLRVRDPELHSGGSAKRARDIRRAKIGRKPRGRRRDDDGEGIFDPMDDSRIHPEHYAVAIKIADEALRDDDGSLRFELGDSEDFPEPSRMVSAVIDDPSGLQRLALDEYAQHLETRGRGCLYETVKTIASEFQGPYRDYRRGLVSPDPEATFYLVTHADPVMIRVGAKVTATECQIRKKKYPDDRGNRVIGISCQLPHEIRGFINTVDFSDDRERLADSDFETLVPDGSTLACRISHFVYDRFEAGLTSRVSVLQDPNELKGYVPLVDTMDPAYRPYPAKANGELNGTGALSGRSLDASKRTQSKSKLSVNMNRLRNSKQARPIVQHPFFRDMTGDDAVKDLRTMLPGDIIIRPSQYGKDNVVFSCKFATDLPGMEKQKGSEGVFHVDCHMDQDPNDLSVPLRLQVDGNTYEDVEQVLEQFLRPIISNLSESLDHRKFRAGSESKLQTIVAEEKRQNPTSIPYVFGLSEKRARGLVLVYVPGTKTVQSEDILVVPDGYRLRSVLHKNMDVLISWFKKNMRKGVTARRPTAAREPSVQASPYATAASPYRDTRSPYTEVRSPFREARSPFREARSPFMAPASPFPASRSPFTAPRSPFNAPRSPFNPPRSPFNPPRSPFMAKPTATPARDVPPPPAPGTPRSRPDVQDPYAYDEPISAAEWSKATLHRDEPPPRVQNGGYDRGPPPRRDHNNGRMGDRDPPPRTAPDFRGPAPERSDSWGPPPRGPPPRGPPSEPRRPHPEPRGGPLRGLPDRGLSDRGPPDRGPPDRGPPDHGPPSRGPPPRGHPPNRRGPRNNQGGENTRPMPSWRGAKPIPAWKKQQEEANN